MILLMSPAKALRHRENKKLRGVYLILCKVSFDRSVIASEAKQSRRDCFVATLLAMTCVLVKINFTEY
jgi:hypothetical protein